MKKRLMGPLPAAGVAEEVRGFHPEKSRFLCVLCGQSITFPFIRKVNVRTLSFRMISFRADSTKA
ncbi:MAG: hypothetical protein IK066_12650 [Kiritimatiellae bacterium]|nr:hypothetical protein [Kiritimatiellia bacterium]